VDRANFLLPNRVYNRRHSLPPTPQFGGFQSDIQIAECFKVGESS